MGTLAGARTCCLSVLTHLQTFKVDPGVAFSGADQTFSQQGTGCMSARRAASVVARLTPILRLVAISRSGRSRRTSELSVSIATWTRLQSKKLQVDSHIASIRILYIAETRIAGTSKSSK